MVVLNKNGFVLPRVERDTFIRLMRLGLEYDRNKGVFRITSYDKIQEATDTLSSILKDEVQFMQTCSICHNAFPCSDCKYADFCETKNLPFQCVCPQCLRGKKSPQQKLF
jgi:hypothetical protein